MAWTYPINFVGSVANTDLKCSFRWDAGQNSMMCTILVNLTGGPTLMPGGTIAKEFPIATLLTVPADVNTLGTLLGKCRDAALPLMGFSGP